MNRRHFLQIAAAGAAGYALDPERLVWVPGRKKIFLPSPKTTVAVLGGVLRKGDVFSITDSAQGPIYAINQITREATEHLQIFIVTADVVADRPVEISRFPVHPPIAIPPMGELIATPGFTKAFRPKDRGWSHRRA